MIARLSASIERGPVPGEAEQVASIFTGPAAIANGIAAATGLRMHELPVAATRVWKAVQSRRDDGTPQADAGPV